MFCLDLQIGQEDQSRDLIKEIKVTRQIERLLITAETTDKQTYQGELASSQTEFSLDKIKKHLEAVECHSVEQQHETLKFMCYDVSLVLKKNNQMLTIDEMRMSKARLEEEIQLIKNQLQLKSLELEKLVWKIQALENQSKLNKQLFGIKMKIEEKKQLRKIKENQLIELVKSNLSFPNLQTVDLDSNKITDAGLKALAENGHKFPNLQRVDLYNNQITDAGLKALAENGHKFPNLQQVGFQNNQITDAGLKALAENGHKFPNLQTVYLSDNQITDAGLKALAENGHKFPNLQRVYLSDNQITDAGLKALAENGHKFPNLQRVDLDNNQITDAGEKKILSAFKLNFRIYC